MRSTHLITGTLAVVASSALIGTGAAQAEEPTTTRERGIVIECSSTIRGQEVWTSVYENSAFTHAVQVVVGEDLGAIRETRKAFRTGRDVRASVKVGGERAVIRGTARGVKHTSPVHEVYDDAGYLITVDGTHRELVTDLDLTWRGRTVPLTCGEAFVYNLQVTKEPVTD